MVQEKFFGIDCGWDELDTVDSLPEFRCCNLAESTKKLKLQSRELCSFSQVKTISCLRVFEALWYVLFSRLHPHPCLPVSAKTGFVGS